MGVVKLKDNDVYNINESYWLADTLQDLNGLAEKQAGDIGELPNGTTYRYTSTGWVKRSTSGGGGSDLPDVTDADDGKVLGVVNGAWNTMELSGGIEPSPINFNGPAPIFNVMFDDETNGDSHLNFEWKGNDYLTEVLFFNGMPYDSNHEGGYEMFAAEVFFKDKPPIKLPVIEYIGNDFEEQPTIQLTTYIPLNDEGDECKASVTFGYNEEYTENYYIDIKENHYDVSGHTEEESRELLYSAVDRIVIYFSKETDRFVYPLNTTHTSLKGARVDDNETAEGEYTGDLCQSFGSRNWPKKIYNIEDQVFLENESPVSGSDLVWYTTAIQTGNQPAFCKLICSQSETADHVFIYPKIVSVSAKKIINIEDIMENTQFYYETFMDWLESGDIFNVYIVNTSGTTKTDWNNNTIYIPPTCFVFNGTAGVSNDVLNFGTRAQIMVTMNNINYVGGIQLTMNHNSQQSTYNVSITGMGSTIDKAWPEPEE